MRTVLVAVYLLLSTTLVAQTTTSIEARHLAFETEGFAMRLQSQVQFRLTIQEELGQSGEGGSNGRDFRNFRVARAKLDMQGHIYEKEFQYRLRLDFVKGAAEMLEIAHFRWAFLPLLNINGGQAPMPWSWEEQIDSVNLRLLERSYANEVFNQGYAKGVWIDGQFGEQVPWVRYWGGVFNGVLAADDDFRNQDGALTADAFNAIIDNELQVATRVETHPLGLVERTMGDLRGEDEHDQILFAIGFGANLFFSGVNNADLRADSGISTTASGRSRVRQETYAFTLDGHFRFLGIGVDAAVYWRHTDFHNRGINSASVGNKQGIGDLEDSGWSFEASYQLPMIDLGVAFRVSAVDADEFWGANAALQQTDIRQRAIRPDAMEYTFNASYLWQGDRLKFSLEISYIDQQLAYAYDGGPELSGVYNDPQSRNGAIGQSRQNADHDVLWIVRFQVQWIF